MNLKRFVKDYLTFTRKEKIGLLMVVALIFFVWISPAIISRVTPARNDPDTSWLAMARALHQADSSQDNSQLSGNDGVAPEMDRKDAHPEVTPKGDLFYFDPNALSAPDWKRLGLRDKTISTIQNYIKKGGHFYDASDLGKIYGIREEEYRRLRPFIKIKIDDSNKKTARVSQALTKDKAVTEKHYEFVDINIADTMAFIALPGIGNKLAARIVSFREKLGGFYSVDQIAEIYGLADSTFQKIRAHLKLESTFQLRKLNMNTSTKDEMKSHPYIKWSLANAIVEYRNQHGNFSSLEDLKKISLITDDVFNKMKLYLTL